MVDALTPSIASVPATPAVTPSLTNYTNPYTSSVLTSALKGMDDAATKRRNQLGADAFSAGAYGDGRHGVEDANITTGLANDEGSLIASTNADAFDKAMGWENTDIDRQTNTALANAGLNNDWISQQLAGMGLGNSMSQSALTDSQNYADALTGLDSYDKQSTQSQDDINYQDFLDKNNYDSSKLNEFLSFMGMTPGQTGTSSSTPDNSWASMLAASLGGIKNSDGTKLFG